MNNEIVIFLTHFNLIQYESTLRDTGLENLQIIHELQDEDITEIIIDADLKQCDIQRFKNAINAVKNETYNSNKQECKYEYKTIESDKKSEANHKKENNKTIIFIGESGVGKTMTINSICNYLYNVKYDDKFRYKLIDENEHQTQKINKYYLNNIPMIQCDLNIIDTPGFTQKLMMQNEIEKCFEEMKFIDTICFVMKATDTRLKDIQKHIFNVIHPLSKFYDNIFILFTFSDGSAPPALKSIDKTNSKYFKINNSGFTLPDHDSNTHKMYFHSGMKQFEMLFNELDPKTIAKVDGNKIIKQLEQDIIKLKNAKMKLLQQNSQLRCKCNVLDSENNKLLKQLQSQSGDNIINIINIINIDSDRLCQRLQHDLENYISDQKKKKKRKTELKLFHDNKWQILRNWNDCLKKNYFENLFDEIEMKLEDDDSTAAKIAYNILFDVIIECYNALYPQHIKLIHNVYMSPNVIDMVLMNISIFYNVKNIEEQERIVNIYKYIDKQIDTIYKIISHKYVKYIHEDNTYDIDLCQFIAKSSELMWSILHYNFTIYPLDSAVLNGSDIKYNDKIHEREGTYTGFNIEYCVFPAIMNNNEYKTKIWVVCNDES